LQEAVRPEAKAGAVAAPRPEIKLPDSLTASQKLRKAFRYRRYGMPIRLVKPKEREIKPLPEVRPEDIKKLKIFQLRKYFLGTWLLIPALIVFILFSWMPILKTVFFRYQILAGIWALCRTCCSSNTNRDVAASFYCSLCP
jgi:hypothetical protein